MVFEATPLKRARAHPQWVQSTAYGIRVAERHTHSVTVKCFRIRLNYNFAGSSFNGNFYWIKTNGDGAFFHWHFAVHVARKAFERSVHYLVTTSISIYSNLFPFSSSFFCVQLSLSSPPSSSFFIVFASSFFFFVLFQIRSTSFDWMQRDNRFQTM